jgi:hypothetical protein
MDNSMNWSGTGYWVARHIKAIAETIGATGGGMGLVKFLRHAPAPKRSSIWAGCLFDTFQDLASNETRIGERRKEDVEDELAAQPEEL